MITESSISRNVAQLLTSPEYCRDPLIPVVRFNQDYLLDGYPGGLVVDPDVLTPEALEILFAAYAERINQAPLVDGLCTAAENIDLFGQVARVSAKPLIGVETRLGGGNIRLAPDNIEYLDTLALLATTLGTDKDPHLVASYLQSIGYRVKRVVSIWDYGLVISEDMRHLGIDRQTLTTIPDIIAASQLDQKTESLANYWFYEGLRNPSYKQPSQKHINY